MKIRDTFSAILGISAFTSALLSSGVKESADWFLYAKPFILFAIVTGLLSLIIHKWDFIRRFTYPAIICVYAWMYEHNLTNSEFSQHTYRVYAHLGKSYRKFYHKVQAAFDYYVEMTQAEA